LRRSAARRTKANLGTDLQREFVPTTHALPLPSSADALFAAFLQDLPDDIGIFIPRYVPVNERPNRRRYNGVAPLETLEPRSGAR
jgi:hypothetical protein